MIATIVLLILYLSTVPLVGFTNETKKVVSHDVNKEILQKLEETQKNLQKKIEKEQKKELQDDQQFQEGNREEDNFENQEENNLQDEGNENEEENFVGFIGYKNPKNQPKFSLFLDNFFKLSTSFLNSVFHKLEFYSSYVWIFHLGQVFWGFYRVGEKGYMSDVLPFLVFIDLICFFWFYFQNFWVSSVIVQLIWVCFAFVHLKNYRPLSFIDYVPKYK